MKKLIALMLSMIMILGLCAGCGNDTPAETPTQPTTPAPTNPGTPAAPTTPAEPAKAADPNAVHELTVQVAADVLGNL